MWRLYLSDLGRLFYSQGHCDAGKYMMTVTGEGDTGKTTLVKTLMSCFTDDSKIADIKAGTFEEKFGLSDRVDSYLCVLPDMKESHIQLNAELMHALIDGERIQSGVKFKSVINKKARCAIAALSNQPLVPRVLRDDGRGSMIHRIAEYEFKFRPDCDDSKINNVMKNELPAIFIASIQEYIWRLNLFGHTKNLRSCKIKYFEDRWANMRLLRDAQSNKRSRGSARSIADTDAAVDDFISTYLQVADDDGYIFHHQLVKYDEDYARELEEINEPCVRRHLKATFVEQVTGPDGFFRTMAYECTECQTFKTKGDAQPRRGLNTCKDCGTDLIKYPKSHKFFLQKKVSTDDE